MTKSKQIVLVVDDNVNNLTLERDLMEVAGFEVIVAEDASTGIALARSNRPDIIIMDVRLPDMRGSEAANILRLEPATHDIPIVFVTASVMGDGREEIRTIPNTGFIGKPINTRTFAKEIIEFMNKSKPVILVVDDQIQNIELLEARLGPEGYDVLRAMSGEEALRKLRACQVDLMLLDVMMPGMDGLEVTRRVRHDEEHRQLPIILITALTETEDRVKGIDAGCDDFISKPVDKMELLARVRSLLKVKAYNDLLANFRRELEAEVSIRTSELRALIVTNRELHERTVQSERLAAVGGAMSSVSHCMKNILTIFKGTTGILGRAVEKQDFGQAHAAHELLERGVRRLENTVLDILDFSKSRESELTSVDVAKMLADVCGTFFTPMIGKTHSLALDCDVAGNLMLDEHRLARALANLLSNAVEATPNGGRIRMLVSVDGPWVKFSVSDSGPGVESGKLEQIFERFYSTKGSRGTGLGLAMVSKFAEECGGHVDATNDAELGGLCVVIYLPATIPAK